MHISRYKAGTYKKQYGYRSFSPALINHEWILDDAKINRLLSEADRKIGELNAFSKLIPDIDFFIKMHIAKEATKSSRIEGTQTSIEEAIQNPENIDPLFALCEKKLGSVKLVVDSRNMLDKKLIPKGVVYRGIGSRLTK